MDNREDIERLAQMEVHLEYLARGAKRLDTRTGRLEIALEEHREESRGKHEDLMDKLIQLGMKLDEKSFSWSRLGSALIEPSNVKIMLIIVAILAGGSGAAALIGK